MPDAAPSPTATLTPADHADLLEAIHYALRFNERGKAHGVRLRDNPEAMAARVAAHLAMAGYVVMKRQPVASHASG